MILLIVFLLLISLYELRDLIKQKQIKEIIVFLCLTITVFITGYIYILDPLVDTSIVKVIMEALGLE